MNANNWCCEITNKTFKLFREKKLYENVWERNTIFIYWEEIDLEKQFCQKCQKLNEREKSRFEADAKEEEKRLNKIVENGDCANCGKLIKLGSNKKRILYRWCNKHHKNDNCVVMSSNLCSLKCWKEVENEDKQYWLQKSTIRDLNQETERKKSLHKKISRQCQSCRKLTDDWVEMDLDMLECRECYEANNEWGESLAKNAEKKRIEKGEEKSSWVIEQEEKEKRGCYDWCADDCPQQFSKSKK